MAVATCRHLGKEENRTMFDTQPPNKPNWRSDKTKQKKEILYETHKAGRRINRTVNVLTMG